MLFRSTRGNFASCGTCDHVWRQFWLLQQGEEGVAGDDDVCWVEARLLLHTPQGIGQPHTKKDPVQMPVAPRVRNPVLGAAIGLRLCISNKLPGDTQHSWAHIFFFLKIVFIWTIFKVFTESDTISLLFYPLVFPCRAYRILAPRSGIKPAPPALEGEIPSTGPPGKSLGPAF